MTLTGHKTEAVYRPYAIVSEADLSEAGAKLALLEPTSARSSASRAQLVMELPITR